MNSIVRTLIMAVVAVTVFILAYLCIALVIGGINGFVYIILGAYMIEPGSYSYVAIAINAIISFLVSALISWKIRNKILAHNQT